MPFGAVELIPGVNTQKTLSANQAGVSVSQLIRYKEKLIQAYGGWTNYVSFTIPSTVRDLHAWQDISGIKHLGVGATANLVVITSASNQDITPQTSTTNFAPNFSISSGSQTVTIVDSNSSGLPSIFNTVFFNTPVSIGNLLLNGAYSIATVLSSISYTITSSVAASTTIASSGTLPIFTASSGSAVVSVALTNNNFLKIPGLYYGFYAPTSVGGLTIQGPYQVSTIVNSSTFTITAVTQATSAATATMNASLAQLIYYVTLGQQQAGSGFGAGGFGSGGFGTGATLTGAPGTPITATDWSLDNWGEQLVACPKDGPIYIWYANSGFTNAQVITQAPFFNGGVFISMPQQIMVAWKSCLYLTGTQDNLLVRWSDAQDYTNWTIENATTAGAFHIPTGSVIIGGMQAASQGLIWTDLDVWAMQFIGGNATFNFTRIGSGCGLIGQHAAGQLSGNVYWMGIDNFYMLGNQGVVPIPCTVWDFVFQNLNTAFSSKIRAAANSAFSEISWFFPSLASTGENDSYVKLNILENEWDYGSLNRTAWADISVLGLPIGSDSTGALYQHETGNVTSGAGAPAFQSGWWSITEGSDMAFVDFVIPDFKWGTFAGAQDAQINITFFSVDYPGDTPVMYGPYAVTQATEYINTRIRGRLMSVQVDGNGTTFWRLGRLRYRYAQAGRR